MVVRSSGADTAAVTELKLMTGAGVDDWASYQHAQTGNGVRHMPSLGGASAHLSDCRNSAV